MRGERGNEREGRREEEEKSRYYRRGERGRERERRKKKKREKRGERKWRKENGRETKSEKREEGRITTLFMSVIVGLFQGEKKHVQVQK